MYEPIGYYVTCDDALCMECVGKLPVIENPPNAEYPWWQGFEGWPEPLSISESDESDSPTHCVECGVLLEHDLTVFGYSMIFDAVLEGFADGKQNPVVVVWLNAYRDYMIETLSEDYEHYDTEHGTIDFDDPCTLYLMLPIDKQWIEREELRKHAVQAGWTK